MRKKLQLVIVFTLFLTSCSEDTNNTEETTKEQIINSQEFNDMKISYQKYNDYKMEEIENILTLSKSSKVSPQQLTLKKEEYLKKCTNLFIDVIEAKKKLNNHFPQNKKNLNAEEILNEIHKKLNFEK